MITKEQILEMPASQEMNILVADLYFHQPWQPAMALGDHEYSYDIGTAWRITERPEIDGQRWYFKLDSAICGGWMCEVWDEAKAVRTRDMTNGDCGINVFAETAPLALCRAALLIALLEEEEKAHDTSGTEETNQDPKAVG